MKLTTHCYAVLLLVTFGIMSANAQTAYSEHTLEKGETLSALAKNYHTTVGDIMRINGMNAQSQLKLGEKIKIPAGGTVAAQKTETPSAAPVTSAPVSAVAKTHTIAAGETLYRISKLYNISVDRLKALNNLSDGSVKLGQTLIVSEGSAPQSPVKASVAPSTAATVTQPAQPIPQKEVTQAAPVKQSAPITETPVQKNTTTQLSSAPAQNNAVSPTDNNSTFNTNYTATNNAPKEGFFTPLYGKDLGSRNEQEKNGAAMTFKSASGWADKKYYILMNEAPTGSVVKIRNGKNELYAKVLWNLGEMKENEGLAYRISTATAAALGITDQKFDLKVSYYE